LEKHASLHVTMLIGVQNIPPMFKDPSGDARDETRLIGAMEQSDEGGRS
jgi:hypothetical protein